MIKTIKITEREPQITVATGVAFTQVDYWYGHTRKDLKMDIIYHEDSSKKYPCLVWVCGGAWLTMDRSAHLAYLSSLAKKGYTVASVEYRTSNEAKFPEALTDVKAAIRYLRANAQRYNIDPDRFATSGESAGGNLALMAAFADDKAYDVGTNLEFSSAVQASVPWYPVADVAKFEYPDEKLAAASYESAYVGVNVYDNPDKAKEASPVGHVKASNPPVLILHGDNDHTVPVEQSRKLVKMLEEAGCDATLLEIEGADHADIPFFQEEVWDIMLEFLNRTIGK